MSLLSIDNLRVSFDTPAGVSRPVDGVCLSIARGERVGIVGESGSGKSLTMRGACRLAPRGASVAGSATLDGAGDLLAMTDGALGRVRGRRIGFVFQDPMTFLNPVMTVGAQIGEVLTTHLRMTRKQAAARAVELLADVRLPQPDRAAKSYPFQLSGGMRQRALIAMALAGEPDLVIADEPTTALDVTVQTRVLDILRERCEAGHRALVLISHDFGVVSQVCDRIAVMYAGKIVEEGTRDAVLGAPAHPYTRALLSVVHALDEGRIAAPIPGQVPDPAHRLPGCAFAPRCPVVIDACRHDEIPEIEITPGHRARCVRISGA
ncbi:ABC transporter ATP-binding protein [bacterium]|nr:ABC transporter ATP-binding protein [bacterium]